MEKWEPVVAGIQYKDKDGNKQEIYMMFKHDDSMKLSMLVSLTRKMRNVCNIAKRFSTLFCRSPSRT